jgi:hypothetical protein
MDSAAVLRGAALKNDPAYMDRDSPGFKKTVSALAWRSFAWFASERDRIVILKDGTSSPARLAALMGGNWLSGTGRTQRLA